MTSMHSLVRHELDAVDWDALRVIDSKPASNVPEAVERLLATESETDAENAYWKLDNRVVVQGQLFDSAPPLVPALFAALSTSLTEANKTYVLDLLVEILAGESAQSEAARGKRHLGQNARHAAIEGLWLAYRLASDPESSVRERAIFIVHSIDPNRDRVARLLAAAANDPDVRVRRFATELAERSAPEL